MKKSIVICLVALSLIACKQQQQARMPISHSSGVFMKESVERNKKLIKEEEKIIDSIIKSDTVVKYIPSQKGYWYSYVTKNEKDTLRPRKGDVAFFTYDVKDLSGKVIYTEAELKPQTYLVDKQDIMLGLMKGIKIMHKNEKVTFLFPSHIAYGYHGDNNKIGTNQPIICTVTLNDFKPKDKITQE